MGQTADWHWPPYARFGVSVFNCARERFMKVVYGTRGMVVSCHPQATAAGWAALRDGGSVADAAIAVAGALAVVMPQSCTIGGDAFILHHDAKSGRTTGINASGRSPALADGDRFADGMAQTGPLSCSVPGVVGGWQALHDRFGRLPWKSLLDRAVELA
ncbi:MAG: hypothetical protein FJX52_08795, partial [Alphaproteobacteria bacterium]|nr:hypothetical protein [Alphaproteobacteria bacterium]